MSAPAADSPPAADDGRVRFERRGRLCHIVIDRPKKLNGFTPKMLRDLAEAFTAFDRDEEAWVGVLSAEGPHFTAGLQLSLFDIGAPLIPEGLVDPLGLRAPVRTKPFVTAVKGFCYTIGIELMLSGDMVVAERGTRFGQVEVKRGLMAYGGATIRMVERAGWGNAMRYLMTGDEFDAETALRLGFVQEIAPDGQGLARATELAERIARQAPAAVRATRDNARIFMTRGFQAAVEAMPGQLAAIKQTQDFAEGVRSFAERREAVFKGK